MNGVVGALVAEGRASLHDLKTIYSVEDAMDLWETVAIPRYNEWLAAEAARKGAR